MTSIEDTADFIIFIFILSFLSLIFLQLTHAYLRWKNAEIIRFKYDEVAEALLAAMILNFDVLDDNTMSFFCLDVFHYRMAEARKTWDNFINLMNEKRKEMELRSESHSDFAERL